MYKLQKERTRLKLRSNTFFVRTTEPWNSLPDTVVGAPSVITFEKRLDKYWSDHPIQYDYQASTVHPRMHNPIDFDDEDLAIEAV